MKPVIIILFSPDTEGDRGAVGKNPNHHKTLMLAELKGVVPALNTALRDVGLTYIGVS